MSAGNEMSSEADSEDADPKKKKALSALLPLIYKAVTGF